MMFEKNTLDSNTLDSNRILFYLTRVDSKSDEKRILGHCCLVRLCRLRTVSVEVIL